MNEYPKIHSIYKRDMNKESLNYGKFILGQYSKLEFEYLINNEWIWTEKIDGTNIRICWYRCPLLPNQLEFKGKTDKAEMPSHLLLKLQQLFTKEKMELLFESSEEKPDICLYGEGYGYKIQKGSKYFRGKKEVDFILFDIKVGETWLKREDIEEIAYKLNINIVPIIGKGTINEAIFLMTTQGIYSTFDNSFLAEGIVLKPKYDLLDRRKNRIITKIKHRDF